MNNTYLGATSFLVQPTGTFKTPEQIAKEKAEAEAEKKRQQQEAARRAGEKTVSFFENLFRKKPETAPQGAALIEAPLQPKSKIPNLVIVLGAVAVVGTIIYLTKKKK